MKVKIKKVKGPKIEVIDIHDEFIKLDSLLKFSTIAETGGEAKLMIQDGEIFVNGEMCTQRGKKIKPGDIVKYTGGALTVRQVTEDALL